MAQWQCLLCLLAATIFSAGTFPRGHSTNDQNIWHSTDQVPTGEMLRNIPEQARPLLHLTLFQLCTALVDAGECPRVKTSMETWDFGDLSNTGMLSLPLALLASLLRHTNYHLLGSLPPPHTLFYQQLHPLIPSMASSRRRPLNTSHTPSPSLALPLLPYITTPRAPVLIAVVQFTNATARDGNKNWNIHLCQGVYSVLPYSSQLSTPLPTMPTT